MFIRISNHKNGKLFNNFFFLFIFVVSFYWSYLIPIGSIPFALRENTIHTFEIYKSRFFWAFFLAEAEIKSRDHCKCSLFASVCFLLSSAFSRFYSRALSLCYFLPLSSVMLCNVAMAMACFLYLVKWNGLIAKGICKQRWWIVFSYFYKYLEDYFWL